MPSILTKGVDAKQLEDPVERRSISEELAQFVLKMTGAELDEEGFLLIEIESQLTEVSQKTEKTFEILDWITRSSTESWLEAAGIEALPLNELSNDQMIAQYLLENGLT